MNRLLCLATCTFALSALAGVASSQTFSDNLSTGANWTIVQSADSSAQFGYDYSQKGVPPAPRGADSIGLKFEVNNTEPGGIEEIVAFNANATFTGKYTLRVDVWSNWALVGGTVGTGTTEFAGVSVGHDGLGVGPFGGSFMFTGDGDSATSDYRLYKNLTLQAPATGQYATGTAATAGDNSNPTYATAFPGIDVATAVPTQGQTGLTANGAGGFQWMTLNVEVDTDAIGPSAITENVGYARISLRSAASGNSVLVGTIDNSNNDLVVALGGGIALLMSDIFTSVSTNPAFSFALFDNVEVLPGLVSLNDPGDFDADGDVDGRDFLVWQRGGSPLPGSAEDFGKWKMNFGTPAVVAAMSAPEPASAILLSVAALTLRRRRK